MSFGGPFPAGGHMQVCTVLTGYSGPELSAFCGTFAVLDALYWKTAMLLDAL